MKYQVGRFLLSMIDDHKLPELQAAHRMYDVGPAGLFGTICAADPSRPVVDIGANVGDTAALIRTHATNRIICVEGNAAYSDHLRENVRIIDPTIAVVDKFITARRAPVTPLRYFGGQGTGVLTTTEFGYEVGARDFISLPALKERFWQYRPDPILFKTDTDGYDHLIMDEALDLFESVFFFEYDVAAAPTDVNLWPDILRRMDDRGFSAIIFDNFGLPVLCAERDMYNLISDMTGYALLQRRLGSVRVYYYDIFAFPKSMHPQYKACEALLRNGLLAGDLPQKAAA